MKKLKLDWRISIFVVGLIQLCCVWCNGQDESLYAPMQKTEQEALYSAIQGFVGKWWNGSDLYPDPCGWTPIQGVSCDLIDGFWYVTELSIGPVHDNSITCSETLQFGPNLFKLNHLKYLSFNCFGSNHPLSIPYQNWELLAGSLETLEFRSNPGLTGRIPSSFGHLINLKSLVLMENGLSGEIPSTLGKLTNLKRLNLCGNLLTGRIPDNLGGLNRALIIDMSRNTLSGVLPWTLGGLTTLLKLDLSNNRLEGNIPREIGNLKNLTLVDLSNNRLSGGLVESIGELRFLEELILSNNPSNGGDLMSVEWGNLGGLTALDLSNMSLTGGIPESLAQLRRLRFLGLNDNKLVGEIPTKLESLPNVSAIFLHGNNLTGELNFSEWFYGKMGRRFGAWGNPYLCCPIGSSYIPFGVKQCDHQEEVVKYEIHLESKLDPWNRGFDFDPNHVPSSGFLVCGFWRSVLVVEVLMVFIFTFYSKC